MNAIVFLTQRKAEKSLYFLFRAEIEAGLVGRMKPTLRLYIKPNI